MRCPMQSVALLLVVVVLLLLGMTLMDVHRVNLSHGYNTLQPRPQEGSQTVDQRERKKFEVLTQGTPATQTVTLRASQSGVTSPSTGTYTLT